jgi:hypothetical protein
MLFIKLILSFVLSFGFWLLYGAPDMQIAGNLAIFGCTVLHLLFIIWNKETFALFGADAFTYAMLTLGINMSSFIWTLVGGWLILYRYGDSGSISYIHQVPYFVWGFLSLGLIGSLLIQMLTTNHLSPLPNRDDRRQYEPPRSD